MITKLTFQGVVNLFIKKLLKNCKTCSILNMHSFTALIAQKVEVVVIANQIIDIEYD